MYDGVYAVVVGGGVANGVGIIEVAVIGDVDVGAVGGGDCVGRCGVGSVVWRLYTVSVEVSLVVSVLLSLLVLLVGLRLLCWYSRCCMRRWRCLWRCQVGGGVGCGDNSCWH